MSIKQKLVIITGASGGIGFALTQLVMEAGLVCGAVSRNCEKFEKHCAKEINESLYLFEYTFDIQIFEKIIKKLRIEEVSLVLNAYDIKPIKKILDSSLFEIEKNIEFNICWQVKFIITLVKICKKNHISLSIIQLDTGVAYHPVANLGLYGAGKAYINMFLRSLSIEEDIPIVLYDPSVVDTNMQEQLRLNEAENFISDGRFHKYKANNQLKSPQEVSKDILKRYLINWTAKEIQEKTN